MELITKEAGLNARYHSAGDGVVDITEAAAAE